MRFPMLGGPLRPYVASEGVSRTLISRWLVNYSMIGFVAWLAWASLSMNNRAVASQQATFDARHTQYYQTALPAATPAAPTATLAAPAATPAAPTATPASPLTLYAGYSYYYPPLGGVNCGTWDDNTGTCADVTASGLPWSSYLGRGVALHPDMLAVCPLMSILHVSSPVDVAGDYIVLDVCPGCYFEGKGYLFDFLSDRQVLPWWTNVVATCELRGAE